MGHSVLVPSQRQLSKMHLDITETPEVEVEIRADGTVLWVNMSGVCVLRVCRTKVKIIDNRPEIMRASDDLILKGTRD